LAISDEKTIVFASGLSGPELNFLHAEIQRAFVQNESSPPEENV
jgi:hypothetical protein